LGLFPAVALKPRQTEDAMKVKKRNVLKKGKELRKASTLGARAQLTPIQMPRKV
jgi:hypothetical protein